MRQQLSSLGRDSAIYGAANAATAGLAFVLVPLYTHSLTSSEFGVYSLIAMIYGLLSITTDCGFTTSISRYYFDEGQDGEGGGIDTYRRSLISTAILTTAVVSATVGAVCYVSADLVSRLGFGSPSYGPFLRVVAGAVIFRGLTVVPMVYLRVTGRAIAYGLLMIAQMSLYLAFNLFFVLILRWGVMGIVYSYVLSAAGWALLALWMVGKDLVARPRMEVAKNLLSLGVPFVPVLFLMWVIDVSDRYLVERYASTREVGLYSLGYSISQIMMLVVRAFTLGFGPFSFRILARADAASVYARVAGLYLSGAGLVWLVVSLFSGEIVALISPVGFHAAAMYVPPVAFGYLLYGLFVLAVTGQGVAKQTSGLLWVTLLAALANFGLNVWLVPWFGAIAAAYTTVLAYAVLTSGCLIVSQRLYPIRYQYMQLGTLLGGMILLFGMVSMLPALPWLVDVGARLGVVAAYGGLILAMGGIRRVELSRLAGAMSALVQRYRRIAVPSSQR
jgi:O-antigen/teichoic acid export membrane protein